MSIRHKTLTSELVPPNKIGATEWDDEHEISGAVRFPAISDPAAPPAGNGEIYAQNIGGRILPKFMGPSGLDFPFQPHQGFNNVAGWRGGNTTTAATCLGVIGALAFTANISSVQNPTPSTASLFGSTRRTRMRTAATAGGVASVRISSALYLCRGVAPNIGGFHFAARFGAAELVAGMRTFVGLWNGTSNPTNIDWLTDTASSRVGIGASNNTGNWQIIHTLAGQTPTTVDLGIFLGVNNTDLIELVMFCPPGGSTISWRARNLSFNNFSQEGVISTNMPAASTMMGPLISVSNNATAAIASLDVVSLYVETDY